MVTPRQEVEFDELTALTSAPSSADEILVVSNDLPRRVAWSIASAALGLSSQQVVQLIQNSIVGGDNITVTPTGSTVVIAGQAGGGTQGGDGWTPNFTLEADGAEREVLRLSSWTGGAGTAPATGYLGRSGLVGTAALAVNVKGARGQQGATGGAGARGPQGTQGPRGNTGPAGAEGPRGPAGATGSQGPQGDTGPQGMTGAQGGQGNTGPRGATGSQGPQGPQGMTGAQGAQGETGPRGPAGSQGATGAQGAQGDPGQGVPTGGTTGQVLSKTGNADYATGWADAASGGGLNLTQVNAAIDSRVNAFARDTTTDVPIDQIPDGIARDDEIAAAAQMGNTDRWPASKLPTNVAYDSDLPDSDELVPDFAGVADGRVLGIQSGALAWIADQDTGGGLTQSEVDGRVQSLVSDWAEVGNSTDVPADKIPSSIARDSDIPAPHTSNPTTQGTARSPGTGTDYALGNHDHGIPARTDTNPTTVGGSRSVGRERHWARGDHDHGIPGLSDDTPVASTTGAGTSGTSGNASRADHRHQAPASGGLDLTQVNSAIDSRVQQFARDSTTDISVDKIPDAITRDTEVPGFINTAIQVGSGMSKSVSGGVITLSATGGSATGITEMDFHRLLETAIQAGSGLMRTIANNVITLATSGGGGGTMPPAQDHSIYLGISVDTTFGSAEFTVNNAADTSVTTLTFPTWSNPSRQNARYVAIAIPSARRLTGVYQGGNQAFNERGDFVAESETVTISLGGSQHKVYRSTSQWIIGGEYEIVTE